MNLEELINYHRAKIGKGLSSETHKEAVELLTSLLPPPKSADIESLPGKPWNAHAVLHDVLNTVPIDAPLMVLWLDKDEFTRFRMSCSNMQSVWMMHQQLHKY